MTYLSPPERSALRNRRFRRAAGAVFVLAALTLLDRWLWSVARVNDLWALEARDWYRLLRIAGYWPTWVVAGLVVEAWRRDRGVERARVALLERPAVQMCVSAGLAGLAAEILKIAVSRERPGPSGEFTFHWPFSALFEGSPYGWGMPSSHAAVAFGAAFMILRQSRAAGWVALLLACGCGLSRMLTGAHFASDVVVGAMLGWVGAAWLLPGRRGAYF